MRFCATNATPFDRQSRLLPRSPCDDDVAIPAGLATHARDWAQSRCAAKAAANPGVRTVG